MRPNLGSGHCGKRATLADKINKNAAVHNLVQRKTLLVQRTQLIASRPWD